MEDEYNLDMAAVEEKILAYEICGRNGHYTRSRAGSSYSALFIIHLRNTIDLKLVMIVFAEAHLSSILYIFPSLPRWFSTVSSRFQYVVP